MNKVYEKQLEHMAAGDRIETPDFEAMWGRIQVQLEASRADTGSMKRTFTLKRKLIPIAVTASFLAAVPAMAGVDLNWERLWSGKSTMNALSIGFGERLNLRVISHGIPLTLAGVVTDDQRTHIPFFLETKEIPPYDAVRFAKAELTDGSGTGRELLTQLRRDPDENRFIGMFQAENSLRNGTENYRVQVKDLVFYRHRQTELTKDPAKSEKRSFTLPGTDFRKLTVTSVLREGRILTLRYEIETSATATIQSSPGLVLQVEGKTLTPKYGAMLPPTDTGALALQSTFELSDEQLKSAVLQFTCLEESERLEGSWDFSFRADREKARQAIYRQDLDPAKMANDSVLEFKELVVTPLEIRLNYRDKVLHDKRLSFPSLRYEKAVLHLGDRDIEGFSRMLENDDTYLYFDSPEWYKDWSKVPMSLTLSEPFIQDQARDDHMLRLDSPSAKKKTVSTTLGNFPVTFTYYMDKEDLIVESSSPDRNFYGITQTYITSGKKRLMAEMKPRPPGGNGTNKTIERYLDIPKGDLFLNPYLYLYTDPSKKVEISITE